MGHETLSTAHKLAHMALDNWQYSLSLLGAACGAVIWAMHRVFATQKHMDACKTEMGDDLERHETEEIARQDAYNTEHAIQHNNIRKEIREGNAALRGDINRLTDHLINGNGK